MELTNSFEVPISEGEAFAVLLDIERIMPCFPGAELLEIVDETTYKCKVLIRLGPIALTLVGTAKIDETDPVGKRARMLAKCADSKGRGGADAVVQFQLEPIGTETRVIVRTNVNLSGAVAQYGRGAGVVQGVAGELTRQFAERLKAMLEFERSDVTTTLPSAATPISGTSVLSRAIWGAVTGRKGARPEDG